MPTLRYFIHTWPYSVMRGEETLAEYLARDRAFHEDMVAHGPGCNCGMGCGPHDVGCDCHHCAPERHTFVVWDFRHPKGHGCDCGACKEWRAWFRKQDELDCAT